MRIIKAASLGLAVSVLASAALAAEPAKCCCKEMAQKASCCDKKGDAKPSEQPAPPSDPHDH